MVGALGAQAVGEGEVTVEALRVEVGGDRRQLVDDRVRRGLADRAAHLFGVERVRDDRFRAEAAEELDLAAAARHADDLVAGRDELRDELLAEGAGGAGEEDLHGGSFRFVVYGVDDVGVRAVTAAAILPAP